MTGRALADSVPAIVLTDDEVVAVALREDAVWSSPLPTLVDADTAALTNAAARGWRSLNVRGLVELDMLSEVLSSCARPVLEGKVVVRTFLVDDQDNILTAGNASSCYVGGEASRLVEFVTPDGVHQFVEVAPESCCRFYEDASATAYLKGVEVPDDWPDALPRPAAFCLAVVDGGAVSVARLGRDEAQVLLAGGTKPEAVADLAAALSAVGLARVLTVATP